MIPKIAVLASGRGSNFQAIVDAIAQKKLQADVVGVLSDTPEAPVLQRAKGLPTAVVPWIKKGRNEQEAQVREILEKWDPSLLVLAGYQRLLSGAFIDSFRSKKGYSKIVNIHPSLLPAFPGLHSYQQAFDYGVKVTGVSVHLVEVEVDTGPICAQRAFSIEQARSWVEVEAMGLAIEHELYPQTLDWILKESFEYDRIGRRAIVRKN